MAAAVDNNYNFTSKPKPIRKSERTTAGLFTENAQENDPEIGEEINQPTPYANIMYDRRIVRGNTYAQAGTVMRKNRFGEFTINNDPQDKTQSVLAPKKRNKKNTDNLLKKLRSGTVRMLKIDKRANFIIFLTVLTFFYPTSRRRSSTRNPSNRALP